MDLTAKMQQRQGSAPEGYTSVCRGGADEVRAAKPEGFTARSADILAVKSVCGVGKNSNISCSLDSGGELSLMISAGTGYTAGKDLRSFGSEAAKLCSILVIYGLNLINTKSANLLAALFVGAAIALIGFIVCHDNILL